MKRLLSMILAVGMLLGCLTGCGGGKEQAGEDGEAVLKLKLATDMKPSHLSKKMLDVLADKMREKTDGKVDITVYHSEQLGNPSIIVPGLMDGSVDMAMYYLTDANAPIFSLEALPYLVSNLDEQAYILSKDSNLFSYFEEALNGMGINLMGLFGDALSGIVSTKDLGNYKDPTVKKDVMIRVYEAQPARAAVTAWGYPCTTIPWGDTYTAVQTGVADAVYGVSANVIYETFRDIGKYYLPEGMVINGRQLMISQKTEEKLGEEYTALLYETADEVIAQLNEELPNEQAYYEDLLENECGFTMLPLTDAERSELADYIRENVWPQFEDVYGEEVMNGLYEDVENAKAYAAAQK